MKLGRIQSRPDARTLLLRNYIADTLPRPPAEETFESTVVWPMLANDRFNCCTSAAAGHMVHHWTAANGAGVELTDDDIIRAHAQLTGDHLLECVTMLDALKLWRNTGIGNHRIHSFVNAEAKNGEQLRQVIHLFGAAYMGLDLPAFACGPDPASWPTTAWAIPAAADPQQCVPLPQNGHCVTAIGYGADGVSVVTWGLVKQMSWEFYARFNIETYAVLSCDWAESDHTSPSGFRFNALARDLSAVHTSHSASPAKPPIHQAGVA